MITFSKLGHLGRLGNQMFQIAATAAHARTMRSVWCLPDWPYRWHFKNAFPICNLHNMPQFTERTFHYSPIPKKGHIDLFGYFQSYKYWEGWDEYVKELFTLNEKAQQKVDAIELPDNSVSVHIRRGDYLQLKDYHHNLPISYYEQAMTRFKGNFVFFSDDIEWCKEHFNGTFIHEDEVTDMFVMAKCERHIIANSSFSWWAAYLGGGETIAPKTWFGRKNRNKNTKDLYLPKWIKI